MQRGVSGVAGVAAAGGLVASGQTADARTLDIQEVTVGTLVGAALPASMRSVETTPSNLPGSTTINLGDEGLDPGDDTITESADHTVTATSDHLGNGYADSW